MQLIIYMSIGLALTWGLSQLVPPRLSLPKAWLQSWQARRRWAALAPQMPVLLEAWSAGLRAGLGLAQALDAVREELGEPAAGVIQKMLDQVKLGQSPEAVLQAFAESLPPGPLSADWRLLASGVAIQRSQGGNLAEILDGLAETLRERQRLQEQIAALTAQGRLSAWVVGLLPPFLLLALSALDPQLTRPLFHTSTGWVVLGLAALMELVGVTLLSKIAAVEA